MNLAVSTSWLAFHWPEGKSLLGGLPVEAGYHAERGFLEELLIEFSVASIHHPCPTPEGAVKETVIADHFNPASSDEDERRRAARSLLETLELAQRLEVKRVVYHGGYVALEGADEAQREMRRLFEAGNEKWLAIRDQILREREARVGKHLDALRKTLEEVLPKFEEASVELGLENRYWLLDIPTLDEMGRLFEEFSPLKYWHDTGHARARACWGLEGELESLREFKERLLGYHIHDALGPRDHKPPGDGDINLLAHLETGGPAPAVLELSRSVDEEGFKRGLKRTKELLEKVRWPLGLGS